MFFDQCIGAILGDEHDSFVPAASLVKNEVREPEAIKLFVVFRALQI